MATTRLAHPLVTMLLLLLTTLGLSACSDSTGTQSGSPAVPPLNAQLVVSGLHSPVYLTAPPGDTTGRLFVVEQGGRVVIVRNGAALATPFLDLTDSVVSGGEQGLLGLAFYPDYAASGRFIVSYTRKDGSSVLARYQVSAGNPDLAEPLSGQTLLTVAQPATNHNGGMVTFGPDGYLYVGLGDGGGGGDPLGTGQDRTDLLGSMLRLDVSGAGGYAIPPSNPYAGSPTFRPELWNYGLRNPWRFSFDRQTGDLYIGDVGQNAVEEIDVAAAGTGGGQNYGWNIMEGTRCYGAGSCNQAGLVPPVLDYPHGDGCSVTGGYVYRGTAIPALQGTYLYGDFCSGWIRGFRWQAGQASDLREWPALAGGTLSSFGEDADGELYLVRYGSGAIYRIVSP
jgi:glucose/arabinose dehydrogenase